MPARDELAALSTRVSRANGWDAPAATVPHYPPIEHVLLIIKENRTYDQVLGDVRQGDGDTSLVFFGRAITPNTHALAERFGLYDRFFVNAEVSNQGHDWTTAAYVTDYREKTTPADYADKRHATNESEEGDDPAEPANGYLWNLAQEAGITYRNYGEFLDPDSTRPGYYTTGKAYLATHSHPTFPSFDMKIPDQRRADLWLEDFKGFAERGDLPALETIWLPRDHTAGGRAGFNTPRAMAADNDYAVGRIVDAVSHSRFWRSTVIFVLEDDSQDGPDHVDSHRSPLLVISPWAAGGVVHRFANTTAVLKTIEEMLHLGSMSQFDHYGRALRENWRDKPDLTPFTATLPSGRHGGDESRHRQAGPRVGRLQSPRGRCDRRRGVQPGSVGRRKGIHSVPRCSSGRRTSRSDSGVDSPCALFSPRSLSSWPRDRATFKRRRTRSRRRSCSPRCRRRLTPGS